MTTITKKKQAPPPPKRPVQVLPYLHEKYSFDKDKVPANLKEPFWYTGKVRKYVYTYVYTYVAYNIIYVFTLRMYCAYETGSEGVISVGQGA